MECLPGFWRVRGRETLLIGGGEAAARKLRFLLRAGAAVRVFPTGEPLHEEVAAAIDAGAAVQVDRPVCAADGEAALLAIVAVEDETAARTAIAVLKAARVPVNAVDRPEACDFLFPAVIDRSPIVLGISTGGAAPVLARRVRAAVESVLPARLGRLAEVAAGFRGAVKAVIPDGPGRKRFWEAFFDGPAADVLAGEEGRAREAALKLLNGPAGRAPMQGRVLIVGAGPGDPDLLTLKALQAMQRADLVLYDSLIGPQILDYVRRDAERVAVGKRKGAHGLTQDAINGLMARHAAAGRTVVRLKGGDPFVFGRGGEEKAFLEARGIPVEVVPGVTAAVGAGAVAGIPLTHREDAQSVTFATGWFQGGAPDLDWAALARPGQTLAVYMGVGTAGLIAERLIAHGAPADRPVAVVEKATLPDQRVLVGRLDGLGRLIAERAVAGPALLIVGDVVRRADAARLAETGPQAVARSA